MCDSVYFILHEDEYSQGGYPSFDSMFQNCFFNKDDAIRHYNELIKDRNHHDYMLYRFKLYRYRTGDESILECSNDGEFWSTV